MGPATSERGLSDFDSLSTIEYNNTNFSTRDLATVINLITVAKSRVEKLGSSCETKIYRLQRKSKNPSYWYIFVVQGLLIF